MQVMLGHSSKLLRKDKAVMGHQWRRQLKEISHKEKIIWQEKQMKTEIDVSPIKIIRKIHEICGTYQWKKYNRELRCMQKNFG